jgi:hypothetical protein
MNQLDIYAIALSGAIIASTIILAQQGYARSYLSRQGAVFLTSIGVGIGLGIFVYFGLSQGDLMGSIFVALVSTLIAGITASITLRGVET